MTQNERLRPQASLHRRWAATAATGVFVLGGLAAFGTGAIPGDAAGAVGGGSDTEGDVNVGRPAPAVTVAGGIDQFTRWGRVATAAARAWTGETPAARGDGAVWTFDVEAAFVGRVPAAAPFDDEGAGALDDMNDAADVAAWFYGERRAGF